MTLWAIALMYSPLRISRQNVSSITAVGGEGIEKGVLMRASARGHIPTPCCTLRSYLGLRVSKGNEAPPTSLVDLPFSTHLGLYSFTLLVVTSGCPSHIQAAQDHPHP
jgi:hypothetical protein